MSEVGNARIKHFMSIGLLYVRIFTIFAILGSAGSELVAAGVFETPVSQITFGAVAGIVGTAFVKVTHIV